MELPDANPGCRPTSSGASKSRRPPRHRREERVRDEPNNEPSTLSRLAEAMMDDRTVDEPPADAPLDATIPTAWTTRLPLKQIGVLAAVLAMWVLIGLACPPHLWRF